MRRRRQIALALTAIVLAVSAAVAFATGGSAAGTTLSCPTSSLAAGQRIVADTRCSHLLSADGRFILYVNDDHLDMDQYVHGAGEPTGSLDIWTGATWTQWSYHDISRRNMTLSLLRSGNLVLEGPRGVVFWQTNTAGSGATHAVLRNNGRLVLLTAQGKRVWASNSGVFALGGGDRVGPGGFLMEGWNGWSANNWGHGPMQFTRASQVTISRMLPSGDFVAYCTNSTRVFWHTNTHTPGSSLMMLESGRLVVESPSGRVMWSSPTGGWRDAFTTLGTRVTATASHFWYARGGSCG